jgi:putative tryptophan/tyrosine transport system substrate-binding protein
MRRREFFTLLGAAIGWPLAAYGQQASKIYRLGYLALARGPHLVEALQTGLRELGYVEGKNLKVEYRFGGQQRETLDTLATQLVAFRPDAIVTRGTPATFAAKQATTTIPIVMAAVGDPVRAGFVSSLAHPGGNITGVSLYASELSGKRVELLKELLPAIARLGKRASDSSITPRRETAASWEIASIELGSACNSARDRRRRRGPYREAPSDRRGVRPRSCRG